MPEQTNNGMQCHEFDVLLADALDGVLTGGKLDRFQAHTRTCSACGPLFAEAEGFGHVHFHVVPRHASLDRELRGPRIFALMGGDPARHVPDSEMDQIARRLTAALSAGL